MRRSLRSRTDRLRTEALLVRRVAFGESDLVVTLFTEQQGLVAAVARGGRRSVKRFAGLEPMHLLRVAIESRPGAELAVLAEASIERPRLRLVADLGRLEAAGRALRWVRAITPAHTADELVWVEVNGLLDRLDAPAGPGPAALPGGATPESLLAAAGLRLLAAFGWGLELARCVRCGRACDAETPAYADPARGGLVCRACGGGRLLLQPAPRARLRAALLDDEAPLPAEDAPDALELVEGALAAHATGG